jgi:lipopolysaccharide heptosyltransferase II
MTRAAWARARRVLCIRLDSLGDVLMTAPALRALRQARLGREIVLLTSRAGADVASLLPEVDDTIVYDAPWLKCSAPRADAGTDREMVDLLRARGFDAAVIFTVYSQSPLASAFLCHLADIPLRLAHCRENPYQLLTNWVPETEPEKTVRHEVRRQLDLVATVGAAVADDRMSLHVPVQARERVVASLLALGVDLDRPWVVVHPGASAPSRRYAPESYAAAARRLVDRGIGIVFSGDVGEVELVDDVRAGMQAPSVSLAGRLDLARLAGLLSLAPVLLSNNSGPVHLAAAVGTPVVDLYALTNPQHTPWGVPARVLFHDVPCKWCYKSVCPEGHHNCLRLVTPEDVADAVLELLAEGREETRGLAG